MKPFAIYRNTSASARYQLPPPPPPKPPPEEPPPELPLLEGLLTMVLETPCMVPEKALEKLCIP